MTYYILLTYHLTDSYRRPLFLVLTPIFRASLTRREIEVCTHLTNYFFIQYARMKPITVDYDSEDELIGFVPES